MITILFRTLTVYFALIVTMRLMGKRQIGELEVTDLVTTLLLSEIASLPVTNQEIPISYAIIPMMALLILEVLSSLILIRFPRLRVLVSAKPTVIIHKGKLRRRALDSLRISIDELLGELRQQGLTDLSQVQTAILEKNGKLTVLPKAAYSAPTAEQLGMTPSKETCLMHIVWQRGIYSQAGLALIDKDPAWVQSELSARGVSLDSLWCVMADEQENLLYLSKEKESNQS